MTFYDRINDMYEENADPIVYDLYTSGKSSLVDFHIIDKGCDHKKKAYLLARRTMKKHK